MNNKLTALVVEGGGMRGVFSAGVLDAFHDTGFDPFDMYIGTSAGACNLASYLSGQYKRNYRCYTDYMIRPEFISLKKYMKGGHYMDLDWFWDFLETADRLDTEAASRAKGRVFLIAATNIETGGAEYLQAEPERLNDMLKASSALPMLYRNFININGRLYADGGIADSIPVEEAYRRGASAVYVIRSRPSDYVKKSFIETVITPLFIPGRPALRRAMANRAENYMKSVEFINNPPGGLRVIEIAPVTICSGRTSKDRNALEKDYIHGYNTGIDITRI